MHNFIHEKYWVNRENCTAEPLGAGTHKKVHIHIHLRIYLLPQFTVCVKSHVHPQLVLQLSFQFHIPHLLPLYDNSYSATFPMSASSIKLQVLSKVKYHIYCNICFITINKCKTVLQFLLASISLCVCVCVRVCVHVCVLLTNILSALPQSHFPITLWLWLHDFSQCGDF